MVDRAALMCSERIRSMVWLYDEDAGVALGGCFPAGGTEEEVEGEGDWDWDGVLEGEAIDDILRSPNAPPEGDGWDDERPKSPSDGVRVPGV